MAKRRDRKSAARVVQRQIAAERRRRRTLWTSVVVVAVLVIAGLIGWGVYQSQRSESGPLVAPPSASATSGVTRGTGPVRIQVYEDFMCPFCRTFEEQSGSTLSSLVDQGRVTVVYNTVAYLDRASTTQYSTRSASAAACAADGGKFLEYHNTLFAQQPAEGTAGLSDDQLISIGTGLGLPAGSFGQCVTSGKYKPWVNSITDAASADRITGTPTIVVDGKVLPNPTPQTITAAVDAAG